MRRTKVDDAARVRAALDRFKPIDPVQRAADYHKKGWTAFDPKSPAYRPSDAEIERIRRVG